jgi:hypothetical protein
MATPPTLFELFGAEADLPTWEARVNDGALPTRDELKAILRANRDHPLPDWLLDLVILGIDGGLRAKPGRRQQGPLKAVRWALAAAKYEETLKWLQHREAADRLDGWPLWQGKHWWNGPPHERAARIVIAQLGLKVDWRSFLNRLSSQKSG